MYQENIDYAKWKKMELWVLHQCIYLILGREPNFSEFLHNESARYGNSHFWSKFDEITKMAEASIRLNTLKVWLLPPNVLYSEILPSEFLLWAKRKGYEIHESFLDLLEQTPSHQETQGTENIIHSEIEQKTDDYKVRSCHLAKAACQGIARTLWDIYPDMTIEDMKEHKAIQIYGNGRLYPGKNTLRNWLSEVDPRLPEAKTGRPRTK